VPKLGAFVDDVTITAGGTTLVNSSSEDGRGVRTLRSLLLGFAVAVVLLAAPAAHAAQPPRLPDCGSAIYGGKVEPVEWSSGCLGGSVNLGELSWSGWGSPEAVATGVNHQNTCDPDCARGEIHDYPVELRVRRIKRCASRLGAVPYYTRFTIVTTYPEGNPDGQPPGPSEPFGFGSGCPTPGYAVPLHSKVARFGAFREIGEGDGNWIESLFGKPGALQRRGRTFCAKRWPRLGLRAEFAVFGTQARSPCYLGIFRRATLTSPRWHTSNGVRPGAPAAVARRAAVGRVRGGFVLSTHRNDCAAAPAASVVAFVGGGRVRRLVVFSHSCE
jgi:hypothetical protein